ncbi:MAG: hypothetical protein A2350_08485 [Candidatus Raymondbacteria bacterium RifOxyB12_full_50_8]|uniref:Outer membrane protein beta-barrel domain-containing protein n=1 Tax=Candidatus Raymondbacteria bacterium RIFOXYD12_FULL_49_13 TaxID=1817890 RepID=A0A1F7FIC2_UNCRA|nr:MAG: hypothetical protein A2248_21540 [Candidatus Raymondbacteria bacterium RIFOXYA2_FULL_49_16]OGJ94684.1 MAG: hypothetical protein A2350_08485 [Candidatus Raymondbacteria bacterium RifOxyB12_full_50_8]OGK06368.1 MAG: hypothetical protein A2519_08865 [Candidatus Raymondbacteria bacterium RIFOXYD12_FULL_49_13]OGP40702.1 MAG: hypothetical protein A2324_03610 [Candidatus Raymondbacteria bacterium RIFOXYB2_FULL_49_35]
MLLFAIMLFAIVSGSFAAGAFVLSPQYLHLDLSPVTSLCREEPGLNNYFFDFSDNRFLMQGFAAYWGSKNNGRAGFGVWGGYRQYHSKPYTAVVLDDSGAPILDTANNSVLKQDSITHMVVIPAYAGILIEKSATFGAVNLFAGGVVGAGALVLVKSMEEQSEESAFYSVTTVQDTNWQSMHNPMQGNKSDGVAVAPLWVFDVHAGATYSFAKWFHAGAEGSLLMLYATDGFGAHSATFNSINPGIRLRIVFGNLG